MGNTRRTRQTRLEAFFDVFFTAILFAGLAAMVFLGYLLG